MAKIVTTEHIEENEVRIRLSNRFPAAKYQTFRDHGEARQCPMARSLFLVMGVRQVRYEEDYVALERDPQVIWPLIIPPAINIISARIKKMKLEGDEAS
jgi:hypothetical protein